MKKVPEQIQWSPQGNWSKDEVAKSFEHYHGGEGALLSSSQEEEKLFSNEPSAEEEEEFLDLMAEKFKLPKD